MANANRIKALRKSRGLTQSVLATELGIATNTLCQYELGTRKVPDEIKISVANYFGVTVDYLLMNDTEKESSETKVIPVGEQVRIPIVGTIRAGTPIFAEDNVVGYEYVESKYRDSHFYLKVSGNSMEPLIRDGALALIRQQDFAMPNQIVACLIDGENATLKRYKPLSGGFILLQAENPSAESYTLSATDFISGRARIMGIVVKVSYYFE